MQAEQDEPNYELFHKWFLSHGGYSQSICFPTKFPPTDYVGVSASADIKPNKVILAVPSKLIINVTDVRNSQLKHIVQAHPELSDAEDEDSTFNVLALFIIYQKMKKKQSFYYPYLQLINLAETITDWSDQQIESIGDPYLTLDYINLLRSTFDPIFKLFLSIQKQYPQMFPGELSWELFINCYSMIMTRCFGWGVPGTIMVPFADFFNHNEQGLNHYMFSKHFQQEEHAYYIKKQKILDLTVMGIHNQDILPKGYEMNDRQKHVINYAQILDKKGIIVDQSIRMNPTVTNKLTQLIDMQLLKDGFETPILLSSDSQDNDSSEEQVQDNMENKGIEKLLKQAKNKDLFRCPKPSINKEFEDGVNFDWWNYHRQDNYFIMSTSNNVVKGQQLYNSYGRRTNRFLLIWYGFTLPINKYDSVPFRFWPQNVYQTTGNMIFTKTITQQHQQYGIPIGDQRYPITELTREFRLKLSSISLQTLTYLRLINIKRSIEYKQQYGKRIISVNYPKNIKLQLKVVEDYHRVLKQLAVNFHVDEERSILKGHRGYFRDQLVASNSRIIKANMESIEHIRIILEAILQGNDLISSYKMVAQKILKDSEGVSTIKRIICYVRQLKGLDKI